MKIGPKYKIARRLKAPIFEKTQTQKFALREGKKGRGRMQKPKTDFGLQLNEKQKARFFYGVTEKQFSNYVKQALTKKEGSPSKNLFSLLESRLDNVVWRAGLSPTHRSARQATSHGHFLVNGRKTTIPSYSVKSSDVISIREGSKNNKIFSSISEKTEGTVAPDWIKYDPKKMELSLKSKPEQTTTDGLFDLVQVIEYYQR